MLFYIIIFISLIILSTFEMSYDRRIKISVLFCVLFCVSLLVGLRGQAGADTLNYINFFNKSTSDLTDYDSSKKKYAEEGFYFISALIKSFTTNFSVYFIVISAITFLFYYKSIKYIALFPILSFTYYFVRFMPFREMNQIRGALAIAIIIFSLKFLVNGKVSKYILSCLIASFFHFSSLSAIPLCFIFKKRFSFRDVTFIVGFSLLGGVGCAVFLKNILLSTGNIVMLTYVGDHDLGLQNPILYYQIAVCLLYTYFKPKLELSQRGYGVLKNAYLYSTVILCLTSGLGSIGGRLSTIFATCEIFIIPSFIKIFRYRPIGVVLIILAIVLIFLQNYNRMLLDSEIWTYKWFDL